MVGVFTNVFEEVFVDSDTASFECLRGNLLFLVADKMGYEGEVINMGFLVSNVVDTDLGLGYTTAVPRLDVGFVLLVAIATSWTTTHLVLVVIVVSAD
jgi:hypothetical protein